MIRFLLIIIAIMSMVYPVLSQQLPVDKEIKALELIDGDKLLEEMLIIYDSLDIITDHKAKIEIANRIFEITKNKYEPAHAVSMVLKVRYGNKPEPVLFEKAYAIAEKYNKIDLMGYIKVWQSMYYIENGIYDKAIYHLLYLRDIAEEYSLDEPYRTALNMLGDIYYNTNLMEHAKPIYQEILEYYKNSSNWNFWRPYMLMNNLGQIALFNGNYEKARYWFSLSLTIADTSLHELYRNNTIAYTKLKLAEVSRLTGDYVETKNLLAEVEEYRKGSVFEDVLQEFYYQKALYLIDKKQYDNSLHNILKLYPSDSNVFTEYRFVPEVYNLLAKVYAGQSLHKKALNYLQKYSNIRDSIEKQGNIARSIILLANRNHQIEKDELELEKRKLMIINEAERKKQNVILILSLIGIAVLIVIIVVIYRTSKHRRKVNRKLNLQKQKIQKYAHDLSVANHTKDRFFSIIAHDLKGPIGSVNNIIQLLINNYHDFDDEERRKVLSSAANAIENTFRLLMNLLDWSRSQRGIVEYNPREFNVRNVIQNVYSVVQNIAVQKGQDLIIEIPDKLRIFNDVSMFETVLRNLLSNAIKFTPEGGRIIVSALSENEKTKISVKDSGIGMSEKMIAELFKINNKTQRKGTNDEIGTGLGLLLCKEFIEKMGGIISVKSEPGKGSVFQVIL